MDAHTIKLEYSSNADRFNLALFSDIHMEADDHDRNLFIRDAEEAANKDARILINGDLCDLILPSDGKRYTSGKHSKKYDAIIDFTAKYVADQLKPYADYIDVIGMGNHETAALKHHHTDLILRVIGILSVYRSQHLDPIHHGGYKGFTRYRFSRNNGRTRDYTIFRFHGAGGSAPVTKGMIDVNRVKTTYRADLYWFGHKHTSIADTGLMEISLNRSGDIVCRKQKAVFTAGYKSPFEQRDYNEDGYILDYSDQFLTAQAQGCALVELDLSGEGSGIRSRLIQG